MANRHDWRTCRDEDCPSLLCRIWREAWREGYDEGFSDGYQAGAATND